VETLEVLLTWTPFLAEGFLMNLLVAGCAVLIGTLGGAIIVTARFALPVFARPLDFITSLARNIPSLVLLFYAASLLPGQLELFDGLEVHIPQWVKASIALAASPLGMTAWNLQASVTAWLAGRRHEAALFIPNWLGGFLISIMASSTASLIGVSELVGRCNTLINATGSQHMLAIYVYASLFFIAVAVTLTAALSRVKTAMLKKL
jgi:polar amino acid transport system permease protein